MSSNDEEAPIRLRCANITRSFNGVKALQEVSIEFPRNGITAIIGPNGAGKTTLVNVLTGFLKPEAGSVWLDDKEITGLPPYRIARSGLVRTFQDVRIALEMSVIDNAMLACQRSYPVGVWDRMIPSRVKQHEFTVRDSAQDALRFTHLNDDCSRRAGDLSYGQQKLLSLACCLALNAQTFLLDEPVAGVHPEMAERIIGVLRSLKERGKQIVFIEHDIESVRRLADEVFVLNEGRVIAHGLTAEILTQPQVVEAYLG